jgi:peptidyl-tRNA hydrolase, PTH1 family
MQIIIGLGNPEEKYEDTRHNLGFLVLDEIARQENSKNDFEENKKLKSQLLKMKIGKKPALLAKPQTYMNLSGEAAKKILSFFKLKPSALLLIHDDMDLPLGKIRFSSNSGPAGHNGVKSVIASLRTQDFSRLRIGTKPKKKATDRGKNFVLSSFSKTEKTEIKKAIKTAASAAGLYTDGGFEKAAAEYN